MDAITLDTNTLLTIAVLVGSGLGVLWGVRKALGLISSDGLPDWYHDHVKNDKDIPF